MRPTRSPHDAHAEAPSPMLRARVLRHVMLPLGLTWLVGTAVMLAISSHFTERAFDRALLDDAYSIASHVRADPVTHEVGLQLSPTELTAALFDQAEVVHFAVLGPDGRRLAGAALPDIALAPGEPHRYRELMHEGQPVRAVALRHTVEGQPYRVLIAHTTRVRGALVQRLLLFAALPQLALLVLLLLWLRRGIDADLAPLHQLQSSLARRDARDLSSVQVPPSTQEIEQLGQTVNALFARVDHGVRAQREFAGNVAHELRTPLAGIRALADYGLTHPDPAVWHQQLQQVAGSVGRASHLVDQLLALALADEGEQALHRERLAPASLLRQAVLRHLDKADRQGVDIGARGVDAPEADALRIDTDGALVEAMLDNLIDNALRYGGRMITLELAAGPAADELVLAVIDDGPGIPESARRALLQRWAQGADGQRLGQGAGLGMAIVARYAQLLGARLLLEDAPAPGGLRAALVFRRAQPAPG
ncbi:sensor histidine kinase N-terminal domain-containing protein [Xenophilus arseniciresistens]|uniref:histidine kinase n=1 Tax=Xenophilus arseniciresistens TaxID=1283306 RepID=A0AAE3T1R4_9BURK|nr:sensor histidine kinase [Xenophilus arseniciresistens]MDA7418880.1 sensor histidine kinase N-terminal domain-containing protein [Xenophilus arseniciresistens]